MIDPKLEKLLSQWKNKILVAGLVQSVLGLKSSEEAEQILGGLEAKGYGTSTFHMTKNGVFARGFLPFSNRSDAEASRRESMVKAECKRIRGKLGKR